MPKRNAPGIGFSLPPPKRQSTLTSRKQAVAQPKAAAEPLPADSSCRFTGEGYIQALIKKHASDERYREFFCKNSVQDVGKLLRRCFTPALLEVLDHRREDDLAALLGIGYDIHYSGAGWYMNVLTDEADPTWFALYPGQSINVGKRVRFHKNKYLIAPSSLHYFTWKQSGKKPAFVLLGQLPAGTQDEELVLNICEQLLGTILQALPEKMLPEYLPPGVEVRLPHRGLMVARAMSQGHKSAVNDSWMLYKATNPLTLRFANEYYKVSLEKGRQKQVALHQAPQIETKRMKSKKAHLFREPDVSLGDHLTVMR